MAVRGRQRSKATPPAEHYGEGVTSIPTAPIAAAGLIGGYLTASTTGSRPLGGLVLAVIGGVCTRSWYLTGGPKLAGGLLGTYLVAFAGSHVLAKPIGAWPSVFTVSAVTAVAAHLTADRRAGLVRTFPAG